MLAGKINFLVKDHLAENLTEEKGVPLGDPGKVFLDMFGQSDLGEDFSQVVGDIEKSEYGNFGWFMDPDGNKVELWQPPES